jgi:hypothetical protein
MNEKQMSILMILLTLSKHFKRRFIFTLAHNEIEFTLTDDEGVSDVSRVVDAKADGENDVDAGEGVDGDGPEVKKANNVNQGQENTNLDQTIVL